MSETEWLQSTDPTTMLQLLRGKATGRKLRLFARACCRSVWHLLGEKRHRKAVGVPEPYLEDLLSSAEITGIRAVEDEEDAVTAEAAWPWAEEAVKEAQAAGEEERNRCCALLRDVFGNPFRPMRVDPAWATWNYGCLAALAQAIYDDDRFVDLPLLAVGLEKAGCKDDDILSHCQQPGEHARGCWLVDALLGKA